MIVKTIENPEHCKWEQQAKQFYEISIDGSILPGIGKVLDPLAFALVA